MQRRLIASPHPGHRRKVSAISNGVLPDPLSILCARPRRGVAVLRSLSSHVRGGPLASQCAAIHIAGIHSGTFTP